LTRFFFAGLRRRVEPAEVCAPRPQAHDNINKPCALIFDRVAMNFCPGAAARHQHRRVDAEVMVIGPAWQLRLRSEQISSFDQLDPQLRYFHKIIQV
jgi:hypothetical protein